MFTLIGAGLAALARDVVWGATRTEPLAPRAAAADERYTERYQSVWIHFRRGSEEQHIVGKDWGLRGRGL